MKRGRRGRALADRLRRNPRRNCTLQTLLASSSPLKVTVRGKPSSNGEENDAQRANLPSGRKPLGEAKQRKPEKSSEAADEGQQLHVEQLMTQIHVLKRAAERYRKEHDEALKRLRDKEALEASVKAQIAARASLQVHTTWLENRYRALVSRTSSPPASPLPAPPKAAPTPPPPDPCWEERARMSAEEAAALRLALAESKRELSVARDRNTELEQAVATSEIVRRRLHEEAMTQRGNMRVFCRLRPNAQTNGPEADTYRITDGRTGDMSRSLRVQAAKALSVDGTKQVQRSWAFEFDRVFKASECQHALYLEVEGLVQSALDGYNVCVFAYGQTASGKTHTMLGGEGEDRGICPRAIDQLVARSMQADASGATFRVRCSILEIYNDNLRDLVPTRRKRGKASAAGQGLQIRHDHQNATTAVEGLTLTELASGEQAAALIRRAQQARAVSKTGANEHSSRSHCVLSLHVERSAPGGEPPRHSVIHLVDLAGSERRRTSGQGASSKQLKEQCAINGSLTALKNTLRALGTQQAHIPFRDSKLTYLLQHALQAHSSKTLMICTVSQAEEHLPESLNTLRFAEKVLRAEAS